MTRSLRIREVRFGASTPVKAEVAVEIVFNPRSDELLELSTDEAERPLLDVFDEEFALLREACAAGFFGTGQRHAAIAVVDGGARSLRLQIADLDVAGLVAFALAVDCVSQARFGLLEEFGCATEELEQVSRLAIDAGGGGSLPAALERLRTGPFVPGIATFLENEPVPLEDFLETEGKGRRLDMELLFDGPLDEAAFAAVRSTGSAWERLYLASSLNADASGEDWVANERDMVGGVEIARSDSSLLLVFLENFEGSPSAALWFLDAVARTCGRIVRAYVNLVEEEAFDPALRLRDLR